MFLVLHRLRMCPDNIVAICSTIEQAREACDEIRPGSEYIQELEEVLPRRRTEPPQWRPNHRNGDRNLTLFEGLNSPPGD